MQHNRRRNWQKRWFVLHQDKLAYFKDQTATDLKGLVLLAGPLAHQRPSPCTYRPPGCHGSIGSHTRSHRSLARSTLHACFVWHVVATPSSANPRTSIARCTHACAQQPSSRQLTHEHIMRHAVDQPNKASRSLCNTSKSAELRIVAISLMSSANILMT